MTSKTPDEINTTIDRAVTDLRKLGRDYEHAHEYAHSQKDRGATHDRKSHVSELVQGSDVRKGNRSDPTGDVVVDQMGARRVLSTVAGRIDSLGSKIKGIRSHMEEVFISPSDDEDEYEPLRRLAAGEAQPGGHVEGESHRRKRELTAELERAKLAQRQASERVAGLERALEREVRKSA